jgi:hypothetical protein
MRLQLTVEVPSNVDERSLSHLLAAVNSRQGITLNVPGSFKHAHTVACTSHHLDVDLVDIERAELTSQEA